MTVFYPGYRMHAPQPTSKHLYTPRQLNQYFKAIRLPPKYLQHPIIKWKSVASSSDEEALRVVKYLIKYQLANIPFENLELHYSTNHSVSIDPAHLFRKMIDRKTGRGGYCMENTQLFVTVLQSLGYDVIATGARVNRAIQPISQRRASDSGPSYEGWNHMVAIVTIGERRYLVDVGFGNNSITFPLPLVEDYSGPNGRPSHQLRLTKEPISDASGDSSTMWVYSVRFTDQTDIPWIPAYCFNEVPFKSHDFEAMSAFVSKNPNSWFTQHVICLKFIMDKHTEAIIGDVTLFKREIKERRNGISRVLCEIRTEKDRVEALHRFLGVRLSDTEKKGIKGMPAMIPDVT